LLGYDLKSARGLTGSEPSGVGGYRRIGAREVEESVERAPRSLLTISENLGTGQPSPPWMDSWQILGAQLAKTVAGYVPGRFRRVVVAASTPTREYAAVMAALGMVRISYRDRVLPSAEDNFRRLAALPPYTMVRAVMSGGGKVEVGPARGLDARGNLMFGRKSLSSSHCADVTLAPWAPDDYREQKFDIAYDTAFIQNMVPSARPELFATEGRTACVVMGPVSDLVEESNLFVARPVGGASLRPIHEVIRPFDRYGAQGWQSVVCGTQSFDWPVPAAEKGRRLLVLDGAAAVNRWIGNIQEADVILALVHRSDSSAAAAADAILNQRRSAVLLDRSELRWTPPPAVEAIAFGEPV
jgi:hypothetical protein